MSAESLRHPLPSEIRLYQQRTRVHPALDASGSLTFERAPIVAMKKLGRAY